MRAKRIQRELNKLSNMAVQSADIFLSPDIEDDYNTLNATMIGPPNTPFEGGVFFLQVKLPIEYPLQPPKVYFKTKIYHPNISFSNNENDGYVCCCYIPVLDKLEWSPILTIIQILNLTRDLLIEPNTVEACSNYEVFEQYNKNREEFNNNAVEWTKKYAM